MKENLLRFFLCVRYYFDLVIDFLFGLYYNDPKKVPPPSNPLLLLSAKKLALKIRKREVKCEEVVQLFIDRIKEVNPMLNAVVDERFDDALEEARKLDEDITKGAIIDGDFDLKPFLGVPFTTKESTACKGMSFTFGLIRRKGRKSSFDADVVQLMKDAGGILLGVTNIPQLNLWVESNNPIYGKTNNPYNTTRNVGGSSGGEASIIAACGSPIGIGTDIGGSIRIPSFMCGIYGHKPTNGLISTNGLTFRTGEEKNTMVSAGPMAKYTEDLLPLLKVLLGKNNSKLDLHKLDQVDISKIKIYYVTNPKSPLISPFRKEMKELLQSVIKHFSSVLDNEPKELDLPEWKHGMKLWRYWMTQEGTDFNYDIANREEKVNSLTEIIKFVIRKSEYNLAVIYQFISSLLPKVEKDWAESVTKKLQDTIKNTLTDNAVLIYPSAPFPPSYHHTSFLRPYNFSLFAIWNALRLPVTQVPLGLSIDGLPIGLQVVAAPYQDHLCLAVAQHLEKQFAGYVPPSK